MNRVFSTVWNHSLGAWVVTSEHASRQGKRGARRLATVLAASGLVLSAPSFALAADLPSGGQIVQGNGAIGTPTGNQLVIDQSSNKLAINWQTFDIAAGNKVTFNQPGKDAVALNRVLGADGSKIMGQLDANGRVFLVNPNGVLFGAGAEVNVGGLVASTLDISDADFAAGNYQFKGDGTNQAVVNQGAITATDGGAVALLGGTVSNQGVIVANQGTVALAAGNKVTLDFAGDGLLNVQVDEAVVDALVENHQLIKADGGQVLLTANAGQALLKTVVNNTGVIEAQTLGNKDGKIVLLGSFDGGTVQVAGTLDASAPNGGNGGFVDTSGAHVKVAEGTKVTTKAASGQTGTWLIDPTDFTVSAGGVALTSSGIGADILANNLASNNVTLQTVATGGEAGDIHVNADISYSQNTLTLNAHRNININAVVSVNGSATLALNYGNTQGNSTATAAAGSTLNVSGGRVDFAQVGTGLLAVNGHAYTVINSLSALQGIDGNLSGNYALGGNIDASATAGWSGGAGFSPIGNGNGSSRYTGTFDGLGHSISGLTIARSGQDFVGLFGGTGNATLRNVGLVGGSITGNNYVGGLVGYNAGSISSSFYATTDAQGSPINGGDGYNAYGVAKTRLQLTAGSTFEGWSLATYGGSNAVWRIYEGSTTPLLRSFLKAVTVMVDPIAGKTYDGNVASGTFSYTPSLAGALLDGSASYASSSANAGSYSTTNGTLLLGGLYSGQQGYDISYASGSSLTISKANLAVSGISASNKTYDGTTAATLGGSASVSAIGSDVVSVGGSGVGTFVNKNAGTGKAVTVSGYSLAGADAGNYNLVQPTGLTADISKANLAVSGISASNKTYDASTLRPR